MELKLNSKNIDINLFKLNALLCRNSTLALLTFITVNCLFATGDSYNGFNFGRVVDDFESNNSFYFESNNSFYSMSVHDVRSLPITSQSFTAQPQPIDTSCNAFIKEYSIAAANYTGCAVRYARPFRLCTLCVSEYLKCESIYNSLLTASTDSNETKCGDIIANGMERQMIVAIHDFIDGTWNDNYCPKCFKSANSTELSDSTQEFLNLLNNFSKCIFNDSMGDQLPFFPFTSNSTNKSVCIDCLKMYKKTSDYYSILDPIYDQHVCMDLSQEMNQTWKLWHEILLCPIHRPSLVPVICVSVALCFIPVLFYIVSKLHGSDTGRKLLREKRLRPSTSLLDDVYRSSTTSYLDHHLQSSGND